MDDTKIDTIDISSGFNWKNTTVKFNDKEIGKLNNKKALKEGGEFQLDANRTLKIQLKGNYQPALELLVNGEPIKGSATDPAEQLNQVSKMAFVIGGLSVVAGLISEFMNFPILNQLGINFFSCIYGLIMIGLGFWVKKRSYIALALIIGLFIFDIIGLFMLAIENDHNPTNGIMMKVFFIFFFAKGFPAIKKLKESETELLKAA
ncbi:hypothetical protein V6R21_21185 [Limibacter armeniacum]|uniref:hypothetical protein n=1 Tax=Limibacter armeniacum TaxID=466084 RepID=UPI002FE4FBFE